MAASQTDYCLFALFNRYDDILPSSGHRRTRVKQHPDRVVRIMDGRDDANKRLSGTPDTKLNIRYAVHPAVSDNILFNGKAGFSQMCQNDYLIFIWNFGTLRISPRYTPYILSF